MEGIKFIITYETVIIVLYIKHLYHKELIEQRSMRCRKKHCIEREIINFVYKTVCLRFTEFRNWE